MGQSVILYGFGIVLAMLAWLFCPASRYERTRISKEFQEAKSCFRPKVLRSSFRVYRFLRAGVTLFANLLLAGAVLQERLPIEVFCGILILEGFSFIMLYELMRRWYQRDLSRCRLMHGTCPKDELPPVEPRDREVSSFRKASQ